MNSATLLNARQPLALLLVVAALGCQRQEPIRRYTVERPPPEHRVWGAIISQPENTWFFKVTGPNAAVLARAPDFQEFLRSVRFRDGSPEFEVPSGWSRRPADQFRFATLEIAASETAAQLEMSVSKLGTPPGDPQAYLLQNINR